MLYVYSVVAETLCGLAVVCPHVTAQAAVRRAVRAQELRSGDHGRVERWRRAQALLRTAQRRPDLLAARGGITAEDRQLLAEFDLVLPG
jgi:tRNA (guanine37-N1)-methyltransferase